MPLAEAEGPKRTRRAPAWLIGSLVSLLLLLLLPIVPAVRPVNVRFGTNWVWLYLARDPGGPPGWFRLNKPPGGSYSFFHEGYLYTGSGPAQIRGVRAAGWVYLVTCFDARDARRVKKLQ
jgi:hypothetical protein